MIFHVFFAVLFVHCQILLAVRYARQQQTENGRHTKAMFWSWCRKFDSACWQPNSRIRPELTQNKKTVKQKSQLWAILNGAQQCYTHHFVWQYFSASINLNLLWFVKYKNFILICCHAVWVCRTIRLHWIVSAEKRDEVEPSTPSASIFNDGNVSFTRKMGKYDITQNMYEWNRENWDEKAWGRHQKNLENK